jgi:hypothetical protein
VWFTLMNLSQQTPPGLRGSIAAQLIVNDAAERRLATELLQEALVGIAAWVKQFACPSRPRGRHTAI